MFASSWILALILFLPNQEDFLFLVWFEFNFLGLTSCYEVFWGFIIFFSWFLYNFFCQMLENWTSLWAKIWTTSASAELIVGRCTSPVIPKTNLNLKIFHKKHEFEHEKTNAKSCIWDGLIPCYVTGWGLTGWVVALWKGTWGSWWTTMLSMNQQGCRKKCTASRAQKVIIPLHSSLFKLHLESNFRLLL